MRVTTQMVNQSAKEAGIPLNQNSLLNYINGSSTNVNNTIEELNKSKTKKANAESAKKYEELEKTAQELQTGAEEFIKQGELSIFEKAKQSGDNTQIHTAAESFVQKYNAMLKDLKSASGTLNEYYAKMLKEATAENEEALEKVGITLEKDGTLKVDKSVLEAADLESLEKAFGTTGTLSTKAAFLASRIENNAYENAKSVSNQYNASGQTYAAASSRYDFWG